MVELTPYGLTFVAVAAVLIVLLPRRSAAVPLMVGVCYIALGQGIQVGPFHFFVIRILILAGLLRALVRNERPIGGGTRLDWLMLWWGGGAVVASAFRADPGATVVFNLGLAFNALGIYFLLRVFLTCQEDAVWLCRVVVIMLVPVALEMALEHATESNLFALFGGVTEYPAIRNGRLRAQGPFAHAILAGTVGAVCLPLAIALWGKYRHTALAGIIACVSMVFTSASSGPLLSAMGTVLALVLWPWRTHMRVFRRLIVGAYLVLDLVMKAPPYYLLARIDLAGGSTGWHRAALIESAIGHLSEWWLAGTDYTRHWMPTGVSWSPNHTDITNYYLQLGVDGGLPLMLLFIAMLVVGFRTVGDVVAGDSQREGSRGFFAWALGASLFGHTATGISVSYFDQSFAFVYLTLAAIATVSGAKEDNRRDAGRRIGADETGRLTP